MTFKRYVQWSLRMNKLRMKWIIHQQFYPFKSLFSRKRFKRLSLVMKEYFELEQTKKI